jgi:glyoxylase-like metal-dependent hydrolase (beta-lactamase superfamily II)/rhodanese-related sulfurtransferase
MKIEQFYDKGLAHASYAILSKNEIAIIDPARDPQQYLDHAKKHDAKIVAVIETHPHADFVSSHAELSQKTGATVYVSKLVSADYKHKSFDEGDKITLGDVTLKAMNTPGHSPDSISIILVDEKGKEHAVFTGDTLFVGDVGRPDLREKAGSIQAKREELAAQMYDSTRQKLMKLPDETLVYPAHGPGSLCGKNMSPDLFSSIGREKKENYALKEMDKDKFISLLLEDQPFIPKYFGYDVSLNKKGADDFQKSIASVPRLDKNATLEAGVLVIDTRPRKSYEKGHVDRAINIMDGGKFETWLGSIVGPDEKFYLIAENNEVMESLIRKAAKIGYEVNIKGVLLNPDTANATSPIVDVEEFKKDQDLYTIVDIRNESELKSGKIFRHSIAIPLPELRERVSEIPTGKPVMVHCAGGYRSAAGASIIERVIRDHDVFDLSDAISQFIK